MVAHTDTRTLLRGAAACAIQAPSTHNTQPWRFRIRDGALAIYLDDTRRLEVIDPLRRQMTISCGCALFNARIAIRAFGFIDDTRILPDPDQPELLATIRPGLVRAPTSVDRELLAAIPRRHTNRRPFLDRPVAVEHSDALALAARAERTQMFRLRPEQKAELAALVAEADRRQYEDPRFRAELGRWLAPTIGWRRDGIPFAEKEFGSSAPFAVLRTLRSLDLGKQFGALEAERIVAAPVIAVLSTQADEPIDWLDCGQALQSVLLRATTLGLATSYLNQVLEIQELAVAVDRLTAPDLNAQMVLRLGWADGADPPAVAPRRELDDVLTVE